MNRQQRRKAYRDKPAYLRETKEQIEKRLIKNGITPQDLHAEYDRGWTAGFTKAAEPTIRSAYAAVCLALNDLYGFGSKRCADVLTAIDKHMLYSLTSKELIDDVYKRMKLKIDFKEPYDRIQEVT